MFTDTTLEAVKLVCGTAIVFGAIYCLSLIAKWYNES